VNTRVTAPGDAPVDAAAPESGRAPAARGERFIGQTVFITGGGRGIGRACALAFAREGARLVLASRTPGQLHEVAKEIAELGGISAQCLPLDVSRADQVRAGVREVLDLSGSIEVLVNCAGLFAMGASESVTDTEAAMLLSTNALGTLMVCQEVGRGMLARGRGRIVNFASLLSFTAFPQRAAYAASKGAVLQLTRVLGIEWASRGVAVNAIAPGMIRTETAHPAVAAGDLSEAEIVRRIPMGRRGRPEDVTGPVLFLASAEAEYITGQALVVDGGWLSYGYL
jgi:2-deoxy-D-gluconate 3-dehydrogenase